MNVSAHQCWHRSASRTSRTAATLLGVCCCCSASGSQPVESPRDQPSQHSQAEMTARAAGVAASAACVAAGPAPPAEGARQGLGRASAVCVVGGPAPHPGGKLERAMQGLGRADACVVDQLPILVGSWGGLLLCVLRVDQLPILVGSWSCRGWLASLSSLMVMWRLLCKGLCQLQGFEELGQLWGLMGWDGALLVSGKGLLQVAGRFWSLGRVVVSWRLLRGWRRCCKGWGCVLRWLLRGGWWLLCSWRRQRSCAGKPGSLNRSRRGCGT